MRLSIIVAVILLAASVAADPVITSVTPSTGPVAGGTTVIIRGSGFSFNCVVCSPPFADPQVWFLETPAQSVKFIDGNTLEVVTPAHLPGRVPVRVQNWDGTPPYTLQDAFDYIGDPNTAFDPILFPIFTPPVRGAFNSEFHTRAKVLNLDHFTETVPLYGVDTSCYTFSPVHQPMYPFYLQGLGDEHTLLPDCSDTVGRIFWVPKGKDLVAANLRVTDVTRQASSHGVEIPVVHRHDFTERRLALLDVPIDPRFRNTLRIYSLQRGEVIVDVQIGQDGRQIFLQPATSWFEPAYASFTDFPLPSQLPAGQSTIRVIVSAPNNGPELPGTPIWAFITVTNNETQEITTITPN